MIIKDIKDKEKLLASTIKKRSIEFNKKIADKDMAFYITFATEIMRQPLWFKLKIDAMHKMGIDCLRCGKSPKSWNDINVDHIKPRKLFPTLCDKPENLQILCGSCNKAKGNKHDYDYRKKG